VAFVRAACACAVGATKIVDSADATLQNFLRDPDMKWLQQNIGRAKGVLIAPQIVKAGFIFGGSGAAPCWLPRIRLSERWNGPAFYALATASVGFSRQGSKCRRSITLVMTARE
jgi:lipid-binding SYLF domain-containing protein